MTCPYPGVAGGRAIFWGGDVVRVVDLEVFPDGDVDSETAALILPPHPEAQITTAALSPDGRLAVTADWHGELRLWNAESGVWLASFCSTTDGSWWRRTGEGFHFVPGFWVEKNR